MGFELLYVVFIVFIGLTAIIFVNNKWPKFLIGLAMLGFLASVSFVLGKPKPYEVTPISYEGSRVYGFYWNDERYYLMTVPSGTKEPVLLSFPLDLSKEKTQELFGMVQEYGVEDGYLILTPSGPTEDGVMLSTLPDVPKREQ